jgi:hypothetical protein
MKIFWLPSIFNQFSWSPRPVQIKIKNTGISRSKIFFWISSNQGFLRAFISYIVLFCIICLHLSRRGHIDKKQKFLTSKPRTEDHQIIVLRPPHSNGLFCWLSVNNLLFLRRGGGGVSNKQIQWPIAFQVKSVKSLLFF